MARHSGAQICALVLKPEILMYDELHTRVVDEMILVAGERDTVTAVVTE